MSDRARVLIADDHSLVAEAFSKLLSKSFDVIGMVYDGRSLIEAAQKLQPDVIVADIGLPILNGLEAAKRIKRVLPQVKIIFVTINHNADLVAEALLRGASGYLPKTATSSELVSAIHQVLKGELYVSPQLRVEDDSAPKPPTPFTPIEPALTERQIEVLQLLAEGRSMKETAAVLNLAARTVAFHKYRLMGHLQLKNDAEVVQYALRHHVVFR